MDLADYLLTNVLRLIPLWLSLAVHEWAHAATADALGDDTARQLGRKSLDPFVHIDPVGTLLLPLIGIPIGWATPVPINPLRFRGVRESTGMWLTAGAGPASNVVFALVAAAIYRGLAAVGGLGVPGVEWLLSSLVPLNFALALFNLLPIPPLDGGRIVDANVPFRWRPAWQGVQRLGPFVLIAVLIGAEGLGVGPFGASLALSDRLLGR